MPLYSAGKHLNRTTSAPVLGGQLVEVTGPSLVGPAGAASTKVVGVAAFDCAAGEVVAVHTGGLQLLSAASAVAAGDVVMAAGSGQVAPIGAGSWASAIGLAHSASTGPTGYPAGVCEVQLHH